MEFHEKLQALRRQKGLTQEELAARLYVSRTAVSKWESGRGFPGIDSLKAVAQFFSVSIDELLSAQCTPAAANKKGRLLLQSSFFITVRDERSKCARTPPDPRGC